MPARRFNKSTAVKYRLLDICAAVCGCALAAALVFMLSSARFSLPKAGFVISSPEIACLRTESANMSSDFPAAIR